MRRSYVAVMNIKDEIDVERPGRESRLEIMRS